MVKNWVLNRKTKHVDRGKKGAKERKKKQRMEIKGYYLQLFHGFFPCIRLQ